jgi:rubrerythrin
MRGARTIESGLRSCDPAVQRAQEAGGPVDHASYTCHCGYLFRAAVSTTVVCPHCGAGQAW